MPENNKPQSHWATAIPVLLIGIPALLINFTVAGYNASRALMNWFDYYAYIGPVVFALLVLLSYLRRSNIYLLAALLVAIAPMGVFFISAYFK